MVAVLWNDNSSKLWEGAPMRNLQMSSVAILAAVSVSGCVSTGKGSLASQDAPGDTCQYDSILYVAGGAVIGFAIAKILGVKQNSGLLLGAGAGAVLGKGKGSYKRRPKHRGGVSVFVRATMRFPNLRAQRRFPSVGFQLLSRRDAVRLHASLL